MSVVIVLCGVPGSGKTTMRNKLLDESCNWSDATWTNNNSHIGIISNDDVVTMLSDKASKSYEEGWKKYIDDAEKISDNLFKYYLLKGMDVIVDMTNVTRSKRQKLINYCNHYGNDPYIYCMDLTGVKKKTILERAEARTDKKIPLEVITAMYDRLDKPKDDEGFTGIVKNLKELLEEVECLDAIQA